VIADFNNEKVVRECDIVLVCVLPSQTTEMFKEIKYVAHERVIEARANKQASKPIFVSTVAVTGYKKLKLMLGDDSTFIRTQINVGLVREYLLRTDNAAPKRAIHHSKPIKLTEVPVVEDKPRPLSVPGKKPKMQKVLSHKALKLGEETGITAEFIVQQTAEQLVSKLEDLFLLFDVL